MADDLQEINVEFIDGKLVFQDRNSQNGSRSGNAEDEEDSRSDDDSDDSQEQTTSPDDGSPGDDEDEVSIFVSLHLCK